MVPPFVLIFCGIQRIIVLFLFFCANGADLAHHRPQRSKVDCQTALQLIRHKSGVANMVSNDKARGYSIPNETGRNIGIPYHPKCQSNISELFEARQCSEYDCFCVNIRTGLPLLGTRGSPTEVGNCSTAIYSVLLAIRNSVHYVSGNQVSSQPLAVDDDDDPVLSPEKDAEMRTRIKSSLEGILNSAAGHQFVTNVSQLVTVRKQSTIDPSTSDMLFYGAHLVSVGHVSVQAPQDLIQHRLHEGYLPDIGDVDSDISRVDLVDAEVDPYSINYPDDFLPPAALHDRPSETHDQWNSDRNASLSKTMMVRSPAPNAFVPEYKVDRESDQLFLDDDSQLSGGVVAPISEFGSSALYQPWQARTSREHIFRQPGIIAGVVGSIVVVLLLLILLILFCIYRLRKKDEGSYALDEPKKITTTNAYQRAPTREFYA